MDIATVAGLVLVLVAILGSIFTGGDITAFIDVPSVLVVGLGVCGGTLIKWPIEVVKNLGKVIMKTLFFTPADPKDTINEIGNLAETARRESIFALEKVEVEDAFLKKAMMLAADNRPPEVIKAILQLEIDALEDRHGVGIDVLDGVGADGYSFGMIGTLIGLVIMLQNLSDQAQLLYDGSCTDTFYGAVCERLRTADENKVKYRS